MTLMNQEKKKKCFIEKIQGMRQRNERGVSKDSSERQSESAPESTSCGSMGPTSLYSTSQTFRMSVATWNVGGKSPNRGLNLDDFLHAHDPSDMYVLGFQEIVPLNAGNVLVIEDNEPAAKWLSLIDQSLNKPSSTSHRGWKPTASLSGSLFFPKPSLKRMSKIFRVENGRRLKACNCPIDLERKNSKDFCFRCQPSNVSEDDISSDDEEDEEPSSLEMSEISTSFAINRQRKYSLVASKQMVGIFVCVWMRTELIQHVGHLRTSCISRGIMGCLGNKGCISVSMTFHQTSFCFICSHLASGEKEGDELRRNSDVIEILKNTQFRKICRSPQSRMPMKILGHDRIVWLGDLNYRIALSYSETKKLMEPIVKLGQWASSERPSLSSSNNNHHSSSSSLPTLQPFGQKNQSFMDMIKSAKAASSQEEELDDEEEFVIKKEISPASRDLRVNVDGKCRDQKATTPRSKHSATEQRRRSKINDRFQMLRTLLPQNDQKRDKASFLLEVIDYIQFLQEKVQRYESSYPVWNCEPAAEMMTWQRSGQKHAEAYADHSRSANGGGATLVFATKVEENTMSFGGSTTNHVKFDTNSSPVFESANHLKPLLASKGALFLASLQPNIQVPVRNSAVTQSSAAVSPDLETKPLQPQSHTAPTKPWTGECTAMNDKLKEQELAIKGGTISISSAYSRGLFDTLTQALHSSGVDLSQATISVQIELGKRAKPSAHKDNDSDQALKKLKTGKS